MALARPPATWLRALLCVFFAALLAARLLSPAGFMPSFEQGGITIVACPDGDPPSGGAHHHGAPSKAHSTCPYAAVPTLAFTEFAGIPLVILLVVGDGVLAYRASQVIGSHQSNRRPPPRGPPIPA